MQCQCEGTSQLGSSIDGIDPARAGGKKTTQLTLLSLFAVALGPVHTIFRQAVCLIYIS
jgi:hypothetical protein